MCTPQKSVIKEELEIQIWNKLQRKVNYSKDKNLFKWNDSKLKHILLIKNISPPSTKWQYFYLILSPWKLMLICFTSYRCWFNCQFDTHPDFEKLGTVPDLMMQTAFNEKVINFEWKAVWNMKSKIEPCIFQLSWRSKWQLQVLALQTLKYKCK